MIPLFEKLIQTLNETQKRQSLFILLDELMQDHQHPQLQVFIKITTFLFKHQANFQEINRFFAAMFDNIFKVCLTNALIPT